MSNFDKALKNWREIIDDTFFLGEIALPREETETFLRELSAIYNSLEFKDRQLALTLLAVNCAYHHYNDSGFWHPFSRFFPAASETQHQEWIGIHIEEFLEKYRKKRKRRFVQRFGPFRYVSHILEECGISLHYMEDFVNFLKLYGHGLDFKNFLLLKFEEYKARIPPDMPKFLFKFLSEESGWRFSCDVARSLNQYGRRVVKLEDLSAQRGYHPNFWTEFFKYFDARIFSELKAKSKPHRTFWSNFDNQNHGRGSRPDWNYTRTEQPRFDLGANKPNAAPYLVHSECPYIYYKPFGNLQIFNSESVISGSWIIIAKINGQEQAISRALLKQNDEGAFLNLDELVGTQAAKIELWFEPVGRVSGETEISRNKVWQCILLDKYTITSDPDDLLMPESEVRVRLTGPQNYSLFFSHPARRLTDQEWIIPAMPATPGKLLAGNLEFDLRIPVYVDMIRIKDTNSKILCAPDDLSSSIVIEGKPGSELKLVAKNEYGSFPFSSIDEGFFFGKNGKLEISIENDLEDELMDLPGSWALISQGTGTIDGALTYISLSKLREDLKNLGNYPTLFFRAFPGESGAILQDLASACAGKLLEPFDARRLKKLTPKLVSLGALYAAGSAILENAPINGLDDILASLPPETARVLRWYKRARMADDQSGKKQLQELVAADIKQGALFVAEWIEKIREEKARIENLREILDNPEKIIEAWIKEVLGPHDKNEYESHIARMDGGQKLTQHWRDFLRKRGEPNKLGGIYGSLEPLFNRPEMVSTLAFILKCAILKATGRQISNSGINSMPEILRPAAEKIADDSIQSASILDPLL